MSALKAAKNASAQPHAAPSQIEIRLGIEHAVTRVLEQSDAIEQAMPQVIRAVCQRLGWSCGARWQSGETAEDLRCAETWGVDGPGIAAFLEAARKQAPSRQPGGLIRRVWADRQPKWLAEVSDEPTFRRATVAAAAGLRSAFAFPIMAGEQVISVMELFSREPQQPDAELIDCMAYVGAQLGQFMQRKQAEKVLREREDHFRALTELSSDLYWMQDAEHRFVVFTGSQKTMPSRLIGKRRWDEGALNMTQADWAAHKAVMDAHQPFRDLELCRAGANGELFWVAVSGSPMFDEAGKFLGYRGISRNITARKRDEQLLRLEHAVNRCLAQAGSELAGIEACVREMCASQDWECGRYFRIDEADAVARFAGGWGVTDPDIERYIAASRGLGYARGRGGVGRVWQTGEPLWEPERGTHHGLAQSVFGKKRDRFVFPLVASGETLGVLAFVNRQLRAPDERLLQTVRVIGSQVGQFLKRMRAEEVVHHSEARFRSLTALSSDWYWEQDEQFRFTTVTQPAKQGRGGPLSTIGKTRWDLPALNMTAADWAAHRAVLAAHQPFFDLELYRRTPEGLPKHTSISGEPVFDSAGHFRGYRGIGKDITERKRAEQLRQLEDRVTGALAVADGVADALRAAIRTVCEAEGWDCGRYFTADGKAGALRVQTAWGVEDDAVQRFIAATRDIAYAPGEGLAGRVWQSGEPIWVADVFVDERSAHTQPARTTGMHGAFVFPVIAGGRTLGVLAFNSRDVRQAEERLLQAIRAIGIQIGQFVQRKHAEEVLRESEERFRSLTQLSSDIYWEQDEELRFVSFQGIGSHRVNRATLTQIGRRRWELNYINMTPDAWSEHIALLNAHRPFRDLELCRLNEAGEKVWVSVSGEPVFDAAGQFRGYRGVGKDITSRKLDEERIQYLANHDALTALPNRAMFGQLLTLAIHNAKRYGRHFAVLFVDLDRFKVINDTLGHDAGDQLLSEIGDRLRRSVRAGDAVARLGGDEFVILVEEAREPAQVEVVARKVLAAVVRPMRIQGQEYRVTASIGICMYPSDAQDDKEVMKRADIAMYRAKEHGKNTYRFYSSEADSHSFERLALETSLRRGLERGELRLHYQPKVDLQSGAITGVEALVRWQHPDLGMVSPAQFIPLAEETGLIVPMGKWVLNTACAQSMAWQRQGLPPVRMSVNLSARQFADKDLLADIAAALEQHGMPAELLELELTESMVMQDARRAGEVLKALKDMGVRLAIDDFGVGYSSLAHLKRFPIDTLKVDRSFVRELPQDAEDKAIIEAIIAMAKSLHLTVVAEGVETADQQAFLKERRCDEMQGYFFSKPVPPEQFAQLLLKQTESARA